MIRDAGEIRAAMVANIDALDTLAGSEKFGIDAVFARLFVGTYRRLIAFFDTVPDPEFAYLTVLRFFDLYDRYIVQPMLHDGSVTACQWKRYAAIAARTTMTSPCNQQLYLLSLGARAHTRHDLTEAVFLAAQDYRAIYGRDPDFASARSALLARRTSLAFYQAAIEFNAIYRVRERGWRHVQLVLHAIVARVCRPLWLAILQSWRRAAWRDAMARIDRPDAIYCPR